MEAGEVEGKTGKSQETKIMKKARALSRASFLQKAVTKLSSLYSKPFHQYLDQQREPIFWHTQDEADEAVGVTQEKKDNNHD